MTKLTAADVSKLSAAELLCAYNELTGQEVVRFSSRAAGERRVLDAILGVGRAVPKEKLATLKAQLDASLADLPAYAMVPDHKPEPARFEVGKTYWTRSAVDHDTVHAFKITARTDKQVQTVVDGKTVRRGLSIYDGVERFKPFGDYSMCAVISARDGVPETDPVLDAGIAAIVADATAPRAAALHNAGAKVTYASAAIAAGLTPKQARKVAERVAGELTKAAAPTAARADVIVAEMAATVSASQADRKATPSPKQAAMIALLTRPQGANRKELLAAMNAVAGASPSACIKLAELFGYDFEYTARTETTPVQYRLTAKVAK